MKQVEDAEILKKFSSPETRDEAFNLLIQKYKQKLYWHIRRLVIDHDDTDDLVQDVFVKVWKNLANFRSDSQLYTWLYRIATNESITFLNKKKQQNNTSLDEVSGELERTLLASPYFDGDKLQLKLQKALLTLPEKQRLIFNMKYFDELKYEEISEITGTSVGALKASFHIAVKKIEAFMLNEDIRF
ncbi:MULTISPECIES: RNA polymerase sigma factor [Pedobacter]|uniref:RNA polymerase sigma factor n=1 Tax=Pedobacter TaxID=84567 RepID=UPI00210E3752|nr:MULTISPECIES: sigma-70 family RNA polymerase sigma factor [unclassified Pedobacter]